MKLSPQRVQWNGFWPVWVKEWNERALTAIVMRLLFDVRMTYSCQKNKRKQFMYQNKHGQILKSTFFYIASLINNHPAVSFKNPFMPTS